jgi:hypothetical protein
MSRDRPIVYRGRVGQWHKGSEIALRIGGIIMSVHRLADALQIVQAKVR